MKLYEIKGFKKYNYDPIRQIFISKDMNIQNAFNNASVRFKKGQIMKVTVRNNRKGSALKQDGFKGSKFVFFDRLVKIGNIYEIVKGI